MISGQTVTKSKTAQHWKWCDPPHLVMGKHSINRWASGPAVPPHLFGQESNLRLDCLAEDSTGHFLAGI